MPRPASAQNEGLGARHSSESSGRHVSSVVEESTATTLWRPVTAGPFVTGTAEVSPISTWLLTHQTFMQKLPDGNYSGLSIEKFTVGLGANLEFDAQVPVIPEFSPNYFLNDQYWFKWQTSADADTYTAWAKPATALEAHFIVPQAPGSGYIEGLFGVLHKRFKPFEFYAQAADLVQNPIPSSTGSSQIMNGNLFTYAAALETVLSDKYSAGLVTEVYGNAQGRFSVFGPVNTPAFSFMDVDPLELEINWPNREEYEASWQLGCFMPVYAHNYPWLPIPMAMVTLYFNGIYGNRLEH